MENTDTDTDAGAKTLTQLRKVSDKAEEAAKAAKAALLERAVTDAMTSTKYGHLSAVAREAGITSQYLRDVINARHPGWLDKAAEEREKEKAARAGGGGKARRSRTAA